MSAIRSALEEWVCEDVDLLDVGQLADDLVELELVTGWLEAERLRRIHSFEVRGGPGHLKYPSLTAFLKHRCRMASGRAHRLVSRSRALSTARTTVRALTGGRLSLDQTNAMLDHAVSLPDQFAEAEDALIGIVEDLAVTDTRRALGYWSQSVDGPGTLRTESEQLEMRGISASPTFDGMLRVDGWMTPLAGQALLSALDALMPPPAPDEPRSPRQRRHDALEDLARSFLDHGETPVVGGEKPHVGVVCDLSALQGIAGGRHETEDGRLLTVPELRTLTCDCSLSRIVIGPASEIIDVGRRTRIIPAAIRRAVVARDRHCTWAGCDRSSRWCDVHHIVHWADSGETKPPNLRLLCRFHHTLIHIEENRGPPEQHSS